MSEQKDTPRRGAGMPEWLLRLTEAKQGGFRNARWQKCDNCGDITLHGMDADMAAGMATVDPAPLTPQQELWCAIQGRRTFSLDIDGERKVKINDRVRWSLAKPHPHGRPIVAQHICGQRYHGFIPELRKPEPTTANTATAEPPF